ncbi:MAG: hypothetical protein MPJ78_11870 [Hyphomicrobiaceae bacterium]|nr:hypothetical protein [Hyphomicrobiaceae bacterium]
MSTWFRIPSIMEIVIQGLLALFLVLWLHDLTAAFGAQACPGGPTCYPWGTEGPVAGVWHYKTKGNYLLHNAAQTLLLAACFVIPFVMEGPRKSLTRVLFVGGAGVLMLALLSIIGNVADIRIGA